MLSKMAYFIERKPKTVMAIIIVITLIFGMFIPSLKGGTSTKDFMPDNEMVRADNRISEYFGGKTEPVMILFRGDVSSPESIKKIYEIGNELKDMDGVKSVVSISTFVSAICGMEYMKNIENCSDEEIENAYHDLLSNKKSISCEDEAGDASYGFADIVSYSIKSDDRNITFIINVDDLSSLQKTYAGAVEWYISFKNRVDPASLNLTYSISARMERQSWEIGRGIKNNVVAFLNTSNGLKTYIAIGKEGKMMNFDINATASIDYSKNEVNITVPRKELGRFGIAPSFGNASLPAKLYNIQAGSRVFIFPSLFSVSSSLIKKFFDVVEQSYFLSRLSNRFIEKFNISVNEIDMLLKNKEKFSLQDVNKLWKNVDVASSSMQFLIKQPFMDDMRTSALIFLSNNSKKPEATLMIASVPGDDLAEEKRICRSIVNFLKNYNDGFDGIEVTGSGVISYQIDELTNTSNKIIMPSIFIAIIILLFINFRKPSYILLSVSGLSIAIIWLFGTMAIVGIKFNTLAVALVPLIMGLGVDYSVHIFHNYLNEIRAGRSVKDAIVASIKEVGLALILATITTAVSFLSFLTASVPSIRDFGILSAIGIAYTFIVAITFEAAARYILDRKGIKKMVEKSKSKFSAGNIMKKFTDILCKHPTKILAFMLILTIFMGAMAVNVKTTFSMEEFMPKDSPAIKTMEKLPSYFPSASQDQEYILIEGNVATVDALKGIKATMENLKDDSYVVHLPDGSVKAESIYSIIKDAIRENESIVSKYNIGKDGIPATDEDVKALYDYLYNSYSQSVKNILHRGNGYDATVIRVYSSLTHLEKSNEKMKILYEQLKDDLSNYGNAKATITGSMVMIYTIMKSLTSSQLSSTFVCIVIAIIVVIIAYRKPLLGILTLLPVIISAIWIMGTMYLAGYSLNVMTVMVTSLTIGLGITYAIHVVERFRLIADRTGDVMTAVEEATSNTGGAVLMAALTTIAGFSVLIFSPMPPEQQFGLITATTILYSFFATILVIPPLLLIWGRWRKKKKGYIISP